MKKVWNRELFKVLVKTASEKRTLFEKGDVNGCIDVFGKLADKLGLDISTVKNWAWDKKTKGATNPEYNRVLEEIFGLERDSFWCEKNDEESQNIMENKEIKSMNEFCKKNVLECYKKMKAFVINKEIKDEEKFGELLSTISMYEIGIPRDVYRKIYDFAENIMGEHIENIYENNVDAVEVIELDEVESMKLIGEFIKEIYELDMKLEEFGRNILQPMLVAD